MARIGGIISLKIDGESYRAKGNFTYSLGANKKEMVVGADAIHGYKELPQVPFIEGEITDSAEISMQALRNIVNATVTLDLANGKLISLRNAVDFQADDPADSCHFGDPPKVCSASRKPG